MDAKNAQELQVTVEIGGHKISSWSNSVRDDFIGEVISHMTKDDIKNNIEVLVKVDIIDELLHILSDAELAEVADSLLEAGVNANLLAPYAHIDDLALVEKLISHHVSVEKLFQGLGRFKNIFNTSPYLDMFFCCGYSYAEILEGLDKNGLIRYEVIRYLIDHFYITVDDIVPHLSTRSIMQNLSQLIRIGADANSIIEKITAESTQPIDSKDYALLLEKGTEPELILRKILPSYVDSAEVFRAIITSDTKALDKQTYDLACFDLQNLISFIVVFAHHVLKSNK